MRVPLRLQTPESLGRSGTRAAKLKAIRRVRGEEDADADASVEHEQGGDALEERLPPPSDNEDDKEWLPQQGQLPSDDEEEGDDAAASGEVGEAGAKVGKKRVRGSGRGGERAGRARLAAPDAEARGRGGRGRGGRGSPSSPIAAPPDPIYSSDTDPDEDDPEVAEVCASSTPPPPKHCAVTISCFVAVFAVVRVCRSRIRRHQVPRRWRGGAAGHGPCVIVWRPR